MELLTNEIIERLRAGDSFAAIEHIHHHGAPLEIAGGYGSLVADLYWKAHDLPAVILIGRAGIIFCLGQSLATDASSEMPAKLRATAKALAYDVGSFTWPGWEEPGINPTREEIAFGADCARLNLRLAIELAKPPIAMSKAHWLVGAHALASGQFELAETEFQRAVDLLPATDPAGTMMKHCNTGYIAVARLCKNRSDANADKCFKEITTHLSAQPKDDAKGYLTQLLSARRLFAFPQAAVNPPVPAARAPISS